MQAIHGLLTALSEQMADCTFKNPESASFNIFRVLGVQTKEVILCRFIGELLSPNGSHDLGTLPLMRFFETVLHKPADTDAVWVELEELIDGNRRVDIAIHCGNTVFPIEVKVWAGDQDAQLSDYYRYYQRNGHIDLIYYLTPYGWSPSKDSVRELDIDVVRCLSFDKDIVRWLEDLKQQDLPAAVSVTIDHFKEIIADMCKENEQIQIIKNLLHLDSENDDSFNPSDPAVAAAVAIMNAKNTLTERIIVNYLKQNVVVPDGYTLEEDTDKEKDKKDKHSYMKVMHGDVCVAWLCVDVNLYLVADTVKATTPGNLWKEVKDHYSWQHLHPDGNGKEFPLKLLSCIFEHTGRIKIALLLNDIVEQPHES